MIHLQKSKISRINLIKKAEKYVKKHSTLEKNWYYSSAFAQPALTFPAATTRTGYLSTIASYNENSLGHLYGSGPVEILAKSKLRHQPPRTETCTKAILQIQCIFCNTPALGIATMNNPPIYRTTAASSSQATITSRQTGFDIITLPIGSVGQRTGTPDVETWHAWSCNLNEVIGNPPTPQPLFRIFYVLSRDGA